MVVVEIVVVLVVVVSVVVAAATAASAVVVVVEGVLGRAPRCQVTDAHSPRTRCTCFHDDTIEETFRGWSVLGHWIGFHTLLQ